MSMKQPKTFLDLLNQGKALNLRATSLNQSKNYVKDVKQQTSAAHLIVVQP